jgi:hypothetical protein
VDVYVALKPYDHNLLVKGGNLTRFADLKKIVLVPIMHSQPTIPFCKEPAKHSRKESLYKNEVYEQSKDGNSVDDVTTTQIANQMTTQITTQKKAVNVPCIALLVGLVLLIGGGVTAVVLYKTGQFVSMPSMQYSQTFDVQW